MRIDWRFIRAVSPKASAAAPAAPSLLRLQGDTGGGDKGTHETGRQKHWTLDSASGALVVTKLLQCRAGWQHAGVSLIISLHNLADMRVHEHRRRGEGGKRLNFYLWVLSVMVKSR